MGGSGSGTCYLKSTTGTVTANSGVDIAFMSSATGAASSSSMAVGGSSSSSSAAAATPQTSSSTASRLVELIISCSHQPSNQFIGSGRLFELIISGSRYLSNQFIGLSELASELSDNERSPLSQLRKLPGRWKWKQLYGFIWAGIHCPMWG